MFSVIGDEIRFRDWSVGSLRTDIPATVRADAEELLEAAEITDTDRIEQLEEEVREGEWAIGKYEEEAEKAEEKISALEKKVAEMESQYEEEAEKAEEKISALEKKVAEMESQIAKAAE